MDVARTRGAAYGLTFGAWHGVSTGALPARLCLGAVLLVWNEDSR